MYKNREQSKTSLDYKLLVLYLLDSVGELSKKEINEILNAEEFADYISISIAIDELENNGELSINDNYYSLTQKAWEELNLFEHMIPHSIRRSIGLNSPSYRKSLLKNRNHATWFSACKKKQICVHMHLQHGEYMQLRLEYTCVQTDNIYCIGKNFKKHSKEIYEKLIEISIEQQLEPNNNVEYKTKVVLEANSKKIYYAVGVYENQNVTWRCKILIPSLSQIEIFLLQWENMAPNILKNVEELLFSK